MLNPTCRGGLPPYHLTLQPPSPRCSGSLTSGLHHPAPVLYRLHCSSPTSPARWRAADKAWAVSLAEALDMGGGLHREGGGLPSLSQGSGTGPLRLSPCSRTGFQGQRPRAASGTHTLGPERHWGLESRTWSLSSRKLGGMCHSGLGACWCWL